MKKFLTYLAVVLLLTGCTTTPQNLSKEVEEKISSVEKQIESLTNQQKELESTVSGYKSQIEYLKVATENLNNSKDETDLYKIEPVEKDGKYYYVNPQARLRLEIPFKLADKIVAYAHPTGFTFYYEDDKEKVRLITYFVDLEATVDPSNSVIAHLSDDWVVVSSITIGWDTNDADIIKYVEDNFISKNAPYGKSHPDWVFK